MSGDGPARAVVSRDLCASVAMCVTLAPGAFELDDDGISTFVGVGVGDGDSDEHRLRDAADGCPMSAIRLVRDDGDRDEDEAGAE